MIAVLPLCDTNCEDAFVQPLGVIGTTLLQRMAGTALCFQNTTTRMYFFRSVFAMAFQLDKQRDMLKLPLAVVKMQRQPYNTEAVEQDQARYKDLPPHIDKGNGFLGALV